MELTVQGAKILVKEAGSGEPVLFLHGNPDSADLWDDIVAQLKQDYRCIAPDLPGFGRSTVPENFDYSLKNLGQFIDDLVTALKITEPLHLVVFDFGGPYGLAWAVKNPDKVKSLTILNTVFFADYNWHLWAKIWRTPLVGEFSMLTMSYPAFKFSVLLGSGKIDDQKIRHTYSFMTPAMKRMVLRLYRATPAKAFAGWEEELLKVTAKKPTQVIWGKNDPYIPKKYAYRLGAQQVHYLNTGHFVPMEASNEISAKIREFLKAKVVV